MGDNGVTDVPGILVGHYTNEEAATGCTVVLCENGAVGGVDVRGSAPGTQMTDLLRPTTMESEVHAVLLGGGSAFGLAAASGVMRYLEDKGVGLEFGGATVPTVSAAILFDLGLVTGRVRPGESEGYIACQNASSGEVAQGSAGAGTGATVGKSLGRERSIKGGIGTYSVALDQGLVVGAIVAVNAIGGIFDPDTGELVAGPRHDDQLTMHNSMELMTSRTSGGDYQTPGRNTTIGVIATNARLNGEQANKLASIGHDGLALAVRPAHLMHDGDTIFALATGTHDYPADMNQLCAASVVSVSKAIVRGVRKAKGLGGIPSVSELGGPSIK